MSKPLYPQTPETKLRGVRRDVEQLKRRSAGPWIYPGDDDDYPYYSPWTDVGPRQRSRYRWLLGGGTEFQLHATGGAAGSAIFPVRPGYYDPDHDPEGSGHDGTGVYRPWHIDGTTGDLVDGV